MSTVLDFLKVSPEPISRKISAPKNEEPDELIDLIDSLLERESPPSETDWGIEILARILAGMVIGIAIVVAAL